MTERQLQKCYPEREMCIRKKAPLGELARGSKDKSDTRRKYLGASEEGLVSKTN